MATSSGLLSKLDWISLYANTDSKNKSKAAYLNFACLVSSSGLFAYFYARSVSPMQLQESYGQRAFKYATYLRQFSFIMMGFATYHFWKYKSVPLAAVESTLHIPSTFSLSDKARNLLCWLIGIPCTLVELKALYDAGMESMRPSEDTEMYGGIYNYVRHPQAVCEWPFWWILALQMNSPAMFVFSTVTYLPVWYWWCQVEEADLLLKYGDSYKTYMENTGCWFPKLTKN